MAHFQEGAAAEALSEFERSYGAVKSPNSHLMIGKAMIDLGRYVDAHRELSETIQEAKAAEAIDPKYAQTRQAAEEELVRVDAQVVKLTVSVSGVGENAVVRVNDKDYQQNELADGVVVVPGPLRLTLVDGSDELASQSLKGRAGESLDVALTPTAAAAGDESDTTEPAQRPTEKRPFPHRRETAYVAAGLGIGGALTFGVFGLLNNSKFSDVEAECDDNRCPRELQDDADRGHTYQTIANVGLVVGLVGLGTAVTLLLTEEETGSARRTATRVSLGPGQISLQGRF
jgi:hypothetical protein